MKLALIVMSVLVAVGWATLATADSGEPRLRSVADLVWANHGDCQQGEDWERRQCRVLREATQKRLRDQVLVMDAAADVVEVGAWDPTKNSMAITLRGCLECKGVAVDGKTWLVAASVAPIHQTARTFASEELAGRWKAEIGPRLRTQLRIRAAAEAPPVRSDPATFHVEVLGFRVFDPCDASVMMASPGWEPLVGDPATCNRAPVVKVLPKVEAAADPAKEALGKEQIDAAMGAPLALAAACHKKHKVSGSAQLRVSIGADGRVMAVTMSGSFANTPTGACIADAIRTAEFPATNVARTTITVPLTLP